MQLTVKTFRDAGLEANWGKSNGAPCIFLRHPSSKHPHLRTQWWMVTKAVYEAMERDGIVEGFTNANLLGNMFSVGA